MTARIKKIILFGAFLIVGLIIYYTFNPALSKLFPKCPFLVLTHLKCPGCGSQRAVHALLHGDIALAWHYNMLLVATLPYIALLLTGEFLKEKHPQFYARIQSRKIIIFYFVLVIAWWIGRNIWNL